MINLDIENKRQAFEKAWPCPASCHWDAAGQDYFLILSNDKQAADDRDLFLGAWALWKARSDPQAVPASLASDASGLEVVGYLHSDGVIHTMPFAEHEKDRGYAKTADRLVRHSDAVAQYEALEARFAVLVTSMERLGHGGGVPEGTSLTMFALEVLDKALVPMPSVGSRVVVSKGVGAVVAHIQDIPRAILVRVDDDGFEETMRWRRANPNE